MVDQVELRSELLELAERCERATWPCDTDAAAAEIVAIKSAICHIMSGRGYDAYSPDYTNSLDAAMTLVPKGFDWIIGRTNGGLTIHAEVGGRGDEFQRFGSNPALALCAAALRARTPTTPERSDDE